MNGDASGGGATSEQLEALKQEILREMRKEMTKMKQEIIEGEREGEGDLYYIAWYSMSALRMPCPPFAAVRMEINRR